MQMSALNSVRAGNKTGYADANRNRVPNMPVNVKSPMSPNQFIRNLIGALWISLQQCYFAGKVLSAWQHSLQKSKVKLRTVFITNRKNLGA